MTIEPDTTDIVGMAEAEEMAAMADIEDSVK